MNKTTLWVRICVATTAAATAAAAMYALAAPLGSN